MRRRITIRLVIFAAAATVVACGADEPSDATPPAESQTASEDFTAQARQALIHEDKNRRLDSAWRLAQRDDISGPAKAELLLEAIEHEIRQPTLGSAPGSYLDASEMARYVYTLALGKVATEAPDTLRDAATGESGELRDRAILALGYSGQRDVIPDLREILRTSSIGDVRAESARLLGDLDAREAIPELREATVDPHRIMVESTMGGGIHELFPVRNSAAKALRKLGFTVELTPEQGYRIVDP